MSLELYHNNMSVCAQRVRLVLAEKGIEPILHHLNLRAGDQHAPDYLALNPNAVVPTLVVDGRPIVEATLISEYLDERDPEPPLRPDDLVARADMRRWAALPDVGLHAACGTLSSAIAFREQLIARGAAAVARNIANTPDPAHRERKRMTVELGVEAPMVAGAARTYDRVLTRMDERLADGRDWLMGAPYTLADSALTPYILRIAHLKLEPLTGPRPRVMAWLDRVSARRNFAGIADFLDDSYLTLMARTGPAACQRIADYLSA